MMKILLIGFAGCLLIFAGVRLDRSAALAQPEAESSSDEELPEGALLQLGSARLRHRDSIQRVAYSPDGRLFAARGSNNDAGVHLWNAQDGRHVRHLHSKNRRGWVEDLSFSPDGQWLVATWLHQDLSLWNVSTGKLRWELDGDKAKAKSVAFGPKGDAIAVAAPDGSVVLRQVKDGTLIGPIAPPAKAIFGNGPFAGTEGTVLAFSPDGLRLTRGVKTPPSITVFDVASGKVISEIPEAHGDPDGNAGGGFSGPSLQWLTMTSDGKRVVSTGYRSVPRENLKRNYSVKNVNIAEIRVWDVETGRQLQDLSGEDVGNSFGYGALAPDGRTLALATMGSLRLWDLESEELVREIDVPGWWGNSPVFSPDGKSVSAGVGHSIAVWNAANGERLLNGAATHDGYVSTVAYSPDGNTVATGGEGTVRVWDAKTGQQRFVRRLGRDANVYDLEFTPDGRLLIAAGNRNDADSPGGVVRLWNVETGEQVREIRTAVDDPWGGDARKIAVSPDSKRLAISEWRSNSAKLQLWDIDAGSRLAMYPPGDELVWDTSDLRFSPDGRYLWSVSDDSEVYRWDTEGNDDFTFIADWRPQDERNPKKKPYVFQATFTSDARTLVTVPITKVLHFWDTASGELKFTLELPGVKKGARFGLSPDGKAIAVTDVNYAGEPGIDAVTVWDIPSRTRRLTLAPHDARAMSFAFSPDGNHLLTGFDRGTSVIWKLESGGH
jgi:WD40 repeat protein